MAFLDRAYRRAQTEGKLILAGRGLGELPQEALVVGSLVLDDVPGYAVVDLRVVDISGNELSYLPPQLLDYEFLKVFDASRNALDDASVSDLVAAANARPPWPALLRLNLAHNALTLVPLYGSPSIRVLDVSHNAVTMVDGPWPRLVELRASHNRIDTLLGLSHVACLEILDCAHNALAELPDELFESAPSLRIVDLSHNRLTALPEAIGSSAALAELHLVHNASLSQLPRSLPSCTALHTLDISECAFAELPVHALLGLPALKVVRAVGNRMRSVPASVAGLDGLVTLDLASNELRSLPPELALCSSLTHLGVEGNPFRGLRRSIVEKGSHAILEYLRTRLPEELLAGSASSGLATSLVPAGDGSLDLSSQGLDELPASFGGLVTSLTADDNGLRSLPLEFAPDVCYSLEALSLARNKLELVPESLLPPLASLSLLNLAHNGLRAPPRSLAALAGSLTSLDLSFNRGMALQFALNELYSLQRVVLSGCKLRSWPFATDDPFPAPLVDLVLDSNAFDFIPPPTHIDDCALSTLDVRNNELCELPPDLGFFPVLSALMFDGNPSRRLMRVALKGTSALKKHLRLVAGADE
ncbi:leucine-rich repeat-containing protein 40 [Thecamonas trahens ATCC 50062]|uniref:Leucine-rich repeat-containing protein 40 n=1 Tax=Thecamonas trahens ATCC 50062 TaxID=461836 RepID=A0A0L0D8V0_THETB|nr:leucine-rich repeat-containing protein 40 [Thecamonas trahens ATCC 50062]KNC48650.1 leucine-rich repeat-containing protein 40 [Thecamonas trahens ATCC 50062]|eukprot:XP_013762706.1 leucine-rich repeat-containing protein 40 [Thecamonas trahens ATCC 50062]